MLELLKNLDRRWIYLTVLLSAIVPLIFPMQLPIAPGDPVKSLYEVVDALPDGSVVLLDFGYGPSTQVELEPAAVATMRHMWRKDIKLVAFAIWPEGVINSRSALRKVVQALDKEGVKKTYGVDYVNLGYKAGGVVMLNKLGRSIPDTFPSDIDGKPVAQLPLMQKVKKYSDIAMVMSLSAGDPGIKHHVQVQSTYGRKVGGAVTAVSAPEYSPYVASGQLVGLMGGLRGAAEYETLVGLSGDATRGMNVQSAVHLVMVIFIIISNWVYFADKRAARRR